MTPFPTHVIIIISSISFCLFLNVSGEFFRDINGNPVINGGTYGIAKQFPLPDETSITWAPSPNSKPCPLYVNQTFYSILDTSSNSANNNQVVVHDDSITIRCQLTSQYIPLNTPIDIYFNDRNTPCKKPLKWSVKSAKGFKNSYYVVAGYENPRYKGYFKVVDAGSGANYVYRLEYCMESGDKYVCLEVGNAGKFPRELFGITSDPQSVNFWALDFYVIH